MEPAVPKMIFPPANHMGLGEAFQEWECEELSGCSPRLKTTTQKLVKIIFKTQPFKVSGSCYKSIHELEQTKANEI